MAPTLLRTTGKSMTKFNPLLSLGEPLYFFSRLPLFCYIVPWKVGESMRHISAIGLLLIAVLCSGCLGSSDSDCGGSCHNIPPATGAHLSHTDGLLPMPCDTCHGEGADGSDHPGHDDGSLTVLGQGTYESDHGTRPAWYGSVWGSSAAFDGFDPGSSLCSGLVCHGLEPVGWNHYLSSDTYNSVCRGCHNITTASFKLPGDMIVYRASNAAANYEGPISGFSLGGHGDTGINNPLWFRDSAPGSSVPLACVACHDAGSPHFPVTVDNPYRMPALALANNLPGASNTEGLITNLCTRTDCHPKYSTGSTRGYLTQSLKHPNDHFPLSTGVNADPTIMTSNPFAYILSEAVSSTTDPAYDPIGRANPVGLSIDRYVDHWAYWNPSAPATAETSDDEPFLPLGDPLLMQVGDSYDNTPSMLVVCTTCHNPHGTDLHIPGQNPGVASTLATIPANRMLRLRNMTDELCEACHI